MLSEHELAFIALHKDNYPRVYRFIQRRINDADLAQELAADIFRVAWQKRDSGEGAAVELAWLLTAARNLVGNAYRSRERQQALPDMLRATAVPSAQPASRADRFSKALARPPGSHYPESGCLRWTRSRT